MTIIITLYEVWTVRQFRNQIIRQLCFSAISRGLCFLRIVRALLFSMVKTTLRYRSIWQFHRVSTIRWLAAKRSLHCALSLAAQCNVIGPVCVFACLQRAGGRCPNLTTASARAVFASLWALVSFLQQLSDGSRTAVERRSNRIVESKRWQNFKFWASCTWSLWSLNYSEITC